MHNEETKVRLQQPRRRRFFSWLGALGGAALTSRAVAHHTESHFEDDSSHHLVYQCNKADPVYLEHVLFSAGEVLRTYSDDAQIVIACFGPGLQLLARHPTRAIPPVLQQRASSLAEYGVEFRACGNTMKSLNWKQTDLLSFAKTVPVGAVDLMLLQEKGFSYISW